MPHRDLVDPLERGDIGRFRRFPRQERRSYTHAYQEVSAQLSARERMAANLLLTAA